ncbi:hypothetical protein Dsin_012912 [Dipteronia sinensis]|uniref:PAP/OAS1 substrate-binding-related domain-containing protein n=1 Tax=Dipteronia sinensis TaxID=43782 RepID=A0AAE0AJ05_9ROSI|nr:hypothetical protein Dsin_012912 [Dipteronia sinensis]
MVWISMADFRVCYGVVSRCEFSSSFESSFSSPADPDPSSISREIWDKAEERTHEILCRIRPTVAADGSRREIVEYVRGLITGSLDCKVFLYGSVPLKTYLPDGDIDLTAISTPNIENTLFSDVYAVLKGEENNKSSYFEVKDVHFIDAEVKLVKCLVQNIVIDISFNQLGGLCTLCFLEKVDGLIGKDHLFKRSIILVKAWCYYESRILGAHHGLISTYALETLVLHVFHLFHSSLNGPLAVLYRFLDYFSKFDWENYCVSLSGPVCKFSLPDVVAKVPENGRDNLLLSEEFLQDCVDKFSVPSKRIETNSRAFLEKHLNIIDALKENNNLGRSVNRGNFYRIRSAFKYGACKLGQILLLPRERLADELYNFFANTLERHETGAINAERSDTCHGDGMFLKATAGRHNDKMAGFRNDERSLQMVFSQAVPEINCTSDINSVLENHCFVDAKGILSSRNGNKLSSMLPPSSDFKTSFLIEESHLAPCRNGKIENGNPYRRMPANSVARDDGSFALRPESEEKSLVASNSIGGSYFNNENVAPNRLSLSIPALNMSENSSSTVRERNSASNLGNFAPLNSLLDLRGHYERYFNNLIFSKHYHFSAPALPSPVSNQLLSKNIWESTQQSPRLELRACPEMKASGGLGRQSYPVNSSVLSNASISSEEQQKTRGTGTYLPKVNYRSNRDRPSSQRGRFPASGATHGQLQRHAHKSSLVTMRTEMNVSGEGSHELSQEEYPVLGNGKSASSDFHQLFPSVWCSSNASDHRSHSPETHESRFHQLKLSEVLLPEESSFPSSDTCSWDSTSSLVAPTVQSPDVLAETNEERVAEQSFHLKNEVDFPPLSFGRMVKT